MFLSSTDSGMAFGYRGDLPSTQAVSEPGNHPTPFFRRCDLVVERKKPEGAAHTLLQ